MDASVMAVLVPAGLGLAVVVWVLHRMGKALAQVLETLAAAAIVFVAIWWLLKAAWRLVVFVVTHWRTTSTVLVLAAWWRWLGWPSLTVSAGAVVLVLTVWRLVDVRSFERWAGRHVRAWWLRWTLYARKLPGWLHACGLSVHDDTTPVVVTVNLVGRKVRQQRSAPTVQVPKVGRVTSGASWDHVRVELVPGQKPEDFDEAARALAVARKVARCQVRELAPNVVSIDFQRRNLLADPVPCRELVGMVDIDGGSVNLRRVFAGTDEYGRPWTMRLAGGHTLTVGATGAGKNSITWCPLVSIAPAIRDGFVRVWGIDPKGMELAYGRRVFGDRYAVSGKDALALLDELVAVMDERKTRFAGWVRTVPITRDDPLELLEFDEIAALTKYTDRKTREQIIERVALLTTQGRALGFTVRGYVQEPTKDTVPVRELFPRRICLRVTAKSHVLMALGDQAYERGAWANRITENEPGVGYIFGEGIREPLRVRAGWVPDETIKVLEEFVTTGTIVPFPGGSNGTGGSGVAA